MKIENETVFKKTTNCIRLFKYDEINLINHLL